MMPGVNYLLFDGSQIAPEFATELDATERRQSNIGLRGHSGTARNFLFTAPRGRRHERRAAVGSDGT
jgi:hypothetical protein